MNPQEDMGTLEDLKFNGPFLSYTCRICGYYSKSRLVFMDHLIAASKDRMTDSDSLQHYKTLIIFKERDSK